jgi:hypothetical protein
VTDPKVIQRLEELERAVRRMEVSIERLITEIARLNMNAEAAPAPRGRASSSPPAARIRLAAGGSRWEVWGGDGTGWHTLEREPTDDERRANGL